MAEAPMFPRERRPARRRFPLLPVVLGLITLLLVGGFGFKAWLDKGERVAYAQAQAIGRDYFKGLAHDAEHYQANFDNYVFEAMHPGIDMTWNREQVARIRREMARYRAQVDSRQKAARAAVAALPVRAGVKRRYLAEVDRTLADKKALIERILADEEAMLKERSAMWELLLSHPGGWRIQPWAQSEVIGIHDSALFRAYASHDEALQRYRRDEGEAQRLLDAPEMWVSASP